MQITTKYTAVPQVFEGLKWDGHIDDTLAEWIGQPFEAWLWRAEAPHNRIALRFGTKRKIVNPGDYILKANERFLLVVPGEKFGARYVTVTEGTQPYLGFANSAQPNLPSNKSNGEAK